MLGAGSPPRPIRISSIVANALMPVATASTIRMLRSFDLWMPDSASSNAYRMRSTPW